MTKTTLAAATIIKIVVIKKLTNTTIERFS